MNAKEWSYLAEGGANIVFKYTSERDEKYVISVKDHKFFLKISE